MSYKLKSNFVIFGAARTGSSLLIHTLNSQQEILCAPGEIFNPNFKYFEMYNKKLKIYENNNFVGYKEWLFNNWLSKVDSQKRIIGYKIFISQIKKIQQTELYLKFLKSNNTKIILLTRNNIFLQYVSRVTAYNIGNYTSVIGNKSSSSIYKLNPVEIHYKNYIKYKNKTAENIRIQLKHIYLYKFPYVHIKYEEFTGEKYLESFQKIFNLLNIDFNNFIDLKNEDGSMCGHKKINIYSLKDKIINFDTLREDAYAHNDTELLTILENN
jgi:LPS sulfotransferase NodH